MEEGSVATSDDDVDENLPPRRGRGRGSSSGRGRGLKRPAAAAKAPKVQKTVAKGANKRPKVIDARSQMPDDNDDRCQMSEGDASTSESEETKRIAKAEAIWKPRPAKDDECEVSSEECEGNADLKSSTLLSFLSWTMEKVLKPEEINALKQAPDLALGELCAGMATATIALQALELKLQEVHQIPLKCQATFYTESVEWKRDVCRIVHKHAGGGSAGAEAALLRRTADLVGSPQSCNLMVGAIECDDISNLSSTPRSVLDATGRSGSSFLEMKDAIKSMKPKPAFIVIECVASLNRMRSSVQEKGTEVVSEKLSELAYVGQWRTVNSSSFGIPQSRSRTYGIFTLLTEGYGPEGKAFHDKQIGKIWNLVERCQLRQPQLLQSLLQQAGFVADASKKKPKSQPAMKRPASKKKDPKWIKQHGAFKKKFKISDAELQHEAIKKLKKHPDGLDETEREIDASCLKLAVQVRKGKLDTSNMVCNVGDSVGYLRWSSSLHPCVLPTKKYLYVVNGEMFTNVNCSGGQIYPLLQGLGQKEMEMCGLHQKLSASQTQDLSGNAFTSNIIAAIMLAICCKWNVSR